MQYDVTTPTEYFEALEEDWRKEKLVEIREMILTEAPELDENIRYKMLNYGDVSSDNFVFALNAQKHYVSLYVGDIKKIDPTGEMLAGFNLGKGCIRVSKTKILEETNLREYIQKTLELWKSGQDIYC